MRDFRLKVPAFIAVILTAVVLFIAALFLTS